MNARGAAPLVLLSIAALALALGLAGCSAWNGAGTVVLDDGTVLSAGEVQRLEALRPKAEAIVAGITGALPGEEPPGAAAPAEVSADQWQAIEEAFADLLRGEFGPDYDTFPVVEACPGAGADGGKAIRREGQVLVGNDERFYFWYDIVILQHRWPWCARHEVMGEVTSSDSWGGSARPAGYVTSNRITIWDQATSGKTIASESSTYPWYNSWVEGYGSYKWGFFPRMPSVTLRIRVDWPALPTGSWDSGARVFAF